MRRISLFIALACMCSMALTGCGSSGSASSSLPTSSVADAQAGSADDMPDTPPVEVSSPESAGKLIMATEAGFKPYEYYEGTDIVGVDVDIAREIAKEMNMELVVEHMEFSAIIPAVDSGKADFGAAGMSITEERAQQVDFTVEYATSKQVILTKADSDIQTADDLSGKTVGVQLGTVADLALSEPEDFPGVKLELYNKYFEAVNDLLSGRIDAIVLDSLPAQELSKVNESLAIRDEEIFTDVYAFCVKKGNTELLDSINTVMQRLMDEGKIAEFTTNHLEE